MGDLRAMVDGHIEHLQRLVALLAAVEENDREFQKGAARLRDLLVATGAVWAAYEEVFTETIFSASARARGEA